MWLFSLNKSSWDDKLFFFSGKNKKITEGDIIKIKDNFFLVLGKKIEYESLYKNDNNIYKSDNIEIFEKSFLSKKTIDFIHRMVKTRFTSYKKVINLFLPTFEIDKLFKYKKNKIKNKKNQELFIFPDLWTAYNILKKLDNLFFSNSTPIQKIKLFRDIKTGRIEKIFCTSSIIFQDRANLKKITIYYPHKRYYKNQKDPRYNTFEVVKKLAEIHKSDLTTIKDYSL